MRPTVSNAAPSFDDVQTRDAHRLRRRLAKANTPDERAAVDDRLAASRAETETRRASRPEITLTDGLPVTERADEIRKALAEHQVVVVCGETGSGKTTQLPKICMQAGLGLRGRIGHTQPRRLAARSVGQRIAEETGTEFGGLVGFQTRFDTQVSEATQVKLMTDGILLAETGRDRFLNQYDTIIIDEAHERTLNVDFLLGYLKRVLDKRADLRVIVTSATIDPERFAEFFADAPIINVEGRGYPVEVRYRPPETDDTPAAIESAIGELWREGPGDVLVFLPGERDIRDAEQHLTKALSGSKWPAEVVPLYARLTRAAQNRIFSASNGFRVVLATNVAETSLTVPGIRYVVDTGLARISRYSTAAKVQRLPIEPVSQASCNQRAGRCGRVAPGICIRLFDEDDFLARPEFTDPEIRRTNLASVLLTMADLRLGDIEAFPFIDPPERRYINDGRTLLTQLQALSDKRITPLGRQLARLPLDPRVGRMLIAGHENDVPVALRVIAAGLTIQDPRERPAAHRQAADEAQKPFVDNNSDFISLLKLWDAFGQARAELSGNKLRNWCKTRFINFMRMREWEDLVRQLKRISHDMGLSGAPARTPLAEADPVAVHKALLPGLLDHIGQLDAPADTGRGGAKSRKKKAAEYLGARGRRFRIFPGSGLAKRQPKWLVAGELLETSALYAHTVAGVDPKWIESAAAHLVTREHYAPHWEKKRGQVAASERVKLFGLTLSDGRKVDFSRIDAPGAREIFVRDGLVDFAVADRRGRLPEFLAYNQAVVEEIEAREARFRRRDLLVDEATQAAFYELRLDDWVTDRKTLDQWLAKNDARTLYFDDDELLRSAGVELEEAAYPESMTLGDLPVALDYAFEPGTSRDGVTARIPLAALNQMSGERAAWLVPGLLEEKFREYLKALPKKWRKAVVPVPDFARAAAERAEFGQGEPLEALREAIHAMTGIAIPADAWDGFAPSPHLRMRFEVVDDDGETVAAGRDIDALRGELGERAHEAVNTAVSHNMRQDGLTEWPEADLATPVTIRHAGVSLQAYPALVDQGTHVDLRLMDDADQAAAAHMLGTRRLLRLNLGRPGRLIKRDLPGLKKHAVGVLEAPPETAGVPAAVAEARRYDPENTLVAELLDALIGARLKAPIVDGAAFEAELATLKADIMAEATTLWDALCPALDRLVTVRKRLSKNIGLDWMAAVEDIRDQIAHLIHIGCLATGDSPTARARALARYIAAIEARLDKLARDGAGDDKRRMQQISPYWGAYKQAAEKAARRGGPGPALTTLRWMIEEFRVQVFAQQLGTDMKVSAKRLDDQLAVIRTAGVSA